MNKKDQQRISGLSEVEVHAKHEETFKIVRAINFLLRVKVLHIVLVDDTMLNSTLIVGSVQGAVLSVYGEPVILLSFMFI